MDKEVKVCITLDLEPDHAGRLEESYEAWDVNAVKRLIKTLKKYQAPLSIFVVGKSLKKRRKIVHILKRYNTEFHLHSYSHKLNEADSVDEIKSGKNILIQFLKQKRVIGYRAPEGRISKRGYKTLKKEGFVFDSSVYPSFWPNIKYFFYPNQPYRVKNAGIIEVPLSTISPFRFPLSLSFIKLLGWRFYSILFSVYKFPKIVIFNFHLHDVCSVSNKTKLPIFWRLIYSQNSKKGFEWLEKFLKFCDKRRYRFYLITDISKL